MGLKTRKSDLLHPTTSQVSRTSNLNILTLATNSIVYAVSGRGAIASLDEQGNEEKRVLDPGDWALIPANREHKEVNDGDEEVVWVIVRAPGGVPEVVNLTGWKGEEAK